MLLALVTQQVVTTREAVDVVAAGNGAVQHDLWRRGLVVGPLMTGAVLWVKEALIADQALVRPLRTIHMSLLMTSAAGMSIGGDDRHERELTLDRTTGRTPSRMLRAGKESLPAVVPAVAGVALSPPALVGPQLYMCPRRGPGWCWAGWW